MQYKLHTDLADFSSEVWNRLASESITDTPFARYEYMTAWWSSRGGGEWPDGRLALLSASDGAELRGLAPLFVAQHDGRQELLLLGSIEISDYLDLLIRPAEARQFVDGMLDFLAASDDFARMPLDWYNVAETSPTLEALRGAAESRGWGCDVQVYRPTPHVELRGDFEDFLSGLDKKNRHEIRRKMRRAAEGPSPAVFELVQDASRLEASVDAFLNLMTHDTEKARFLTPEMRAHMRRLMRWAWDAGLLWLAFLWVNEAPAAAAFNFDYGGKLWGYNSAVNRDFLGLSPGWVLLGHQIQWACEHGRSELDFMRGDEEYKYRFGAVDRHVMRVRLSPDRAG